MRWRLALPESGGGKTYELRVLRPNGGLSYSAAGTGPPPTAAATGVNELTLPSPLPVQAGDIVAVNCPPGAPSPFTASGTKGSIYGVLNPTLTDGNTGTAKTFPGDEMLINADFVRRSDPDLDRSLVGVFQGWGLYGRDHRNQLLGSHLRELRRRAVKELHRQF